MWFKFHQNRPNCVQIKGCDRHTHIYTHTNRRTDMPRPRVNIFSPEMARRHLYQSNIFKEEWERKRVFHFACRAYSFYILISELFNFKIMQRKRGVTGLDFSLDPSLCMFLTYFSNQSIIA